MDNRNSMNLLRDNKWQVAISFLGPYCIVPHGPKDGAPSNGRGSGYVNVHLDGRGYRPYIRGTLVRSSLIRSVEFFISLEKYLLELKGGKRIFRALSCCPGEYERREGSVASFLARRSARFDFGLKGLCTDVETACPLCLLLNRLDPPEDRRLAGRQSVHFTNFDAEIETPFPSFESFAGNRTRNRIDRSTGKAGEQYDTWEIDESCCNRYRGTITFGRNVRNLPVLKHLLAAGLAQIDTLAGAPCRVDILDSRGGISAHQRLLKAFFRPGKVMTEAGSEKDDLSAAEVHVRPVKAALDEMRAFETGGRSQPSHPSGGGKGERPVSLERLPVFEWIVRGRLTAETPFAVGASPDDGKTGLAVAPAPGDCLRIPHSAIRGALRETMEGMIEEDACLASPGNPAPCRCEVCSILSRVTLTDARSDCGFSVQTQRRIAVASDSGTLEKGAVFDIKTGPQGLRFSFELRFTSPREAIDPLLLKSLALWRRGMLFLGGHQATGKGRMSLEITGSRLLELDAAPDLLKRLLGRGCFGERGRRLLQALPEREIKFPDADSPWLAMGYSLTVNSPLVLGIHEPAPHREGSREGTPDASPARKTILEGQADGSYRSICLPVLGGESLRGLLRHAMARTIFPAHHAREDCRCDLCVLLGNERHKGMLVIEDAEPVNEEGELLDPEALEIENFDRIAIDRFQGGAVCGSGFVDAALIATPDRPLAFKGIIWVRDTLREKRCEGARNLLARALADLRDGMLPLGGSGSAGYGKVAALRLHENPLDLALRPKPKTAPHPRVGRIAGSVPQSAPPDAETVHHPYYFLKTGGSVVRTREIVPHDRYLEDRYTGKLLCSIETRGPLFVPGTREIAGKGTHQSRRFMRIGGRPALPGSTIRGAVSGVFEALTNSCLRVFNEERRLSWRMDASYEGNLEYYRPGRAVLDAGKWKIERMTEARLPFYDCTETFSEIPQPTRADTAIAGSAALVREFLESLPKPERDGILRGRIPVGVELARADRKNPHDTIVRSLNPGGVKGYLKISGPNVLEVKRYKGPDGSPVFLDEAVFDECSMDGIRHEVVSLVKVKNRTRRIPVTRRFGKKEDRIVEYIMKKRCERVFLETPERRLYDVPKAVVERYADLVRVMKENPQAPPRIFRTSPLNLDGYAGLQDGDLIYFRGNDATGAVIDIVPVRISRRMAPQRLGGMLDRAFRTCAPLRPRKGTLRADAADADGSPEKPEPGGLCPACHLFGTASYKGRVRFGAAFHKGHANWHMGAEDDAGTRGKLLILPVLEAPRPAWAIPAPRTLDREPPGVPGRKFYVHHPSSVGNLLDKRVETGPNNCSVEPLGKGNRFEFEVDFENLSEAELGLLVYSIELQEGLGHKLGRGKPLGLGSATMSVEAILCRNEENGALSRDLTARKPTIEESGFRQLEEWSRRDGEDRRWPEIPRIADLHGLLRLVDSESVNVFYPKLKQDQSVDGGYPSYETIKEAWSHEERRRHLTDPWHPWHPLGNTRAAESRSRTQPIGKKRRKAAPGAQGRITIDGPGGSAARRQLGPATQLNTLYVTNLPYSSTTDDVKSLFSKAGKVVWVRLLEDRESGRMKGNGFVLMASAEEAAKAKELLDNAVLKERPVRVDWAKPWKGGSRK